MTTGDLDDLFAQIQALILPQPPTIPSQNVLVWWDDALIPGVPAAILSLAQPSESEFRALGTPPPINERHVIAIDFLQSIVVAGSLRVAQEQIKGWVQTCVVNVAANPTLVDASHVQHAVLIGAFADRPSPMKWHIGRQIDRQTGQNLARGTLVIPVEGLWDVT